MENKIKLTIGIPVFNGERFIGKALDSILNEIDENNKKILEIVISDNDSKDETAEIVKSYLNKNEKLIKYYKNNENYGYDKNIDLLVERARGEYVWFLGCGELIKKGSINLVLEEILKDTYDNILLNFDIYSEDLGKIESESAFITETNKVYDNAEEFLVDKNGPAMAVSANIVLKKAWECVNSKILLENGWCHYERIMEIILSNNYNKTLFIATPSFTLYREVDGWWTTEKVYINFMNYVNLLDKLTNNRVNEKNRKILLKRVQGIALIHSIILGRKAGLKINIKILSETIKIFKKSSMFWTLGILVIFLPNTILKSKTIDRIFKFLMNKLRLIKKGISNVNK